MITTTSDPGEGGAARGRCDGLCEAAQGRCRRRWSLEVRFADPCRHSEVKFREGDPPVAEHRLRDLLGSLVGGFRK